mgnify:CR=1 FL=1
MKTPPNGLPLSPLATIVDGPLTPQAEALSHVGGAGGLGLSGAVLRFEGVVRRDEADPDRGGELRALEALEYQTYDPMAQRELEALARGVAERHGLRSIVALHSRGRVHVGEVSFVLIVTAAHRAEAIAALTEFVDRLKQDVPIWKRPVWA